MAKRDEKSGVEKLKSRLYDRGVVGKEVKEERATLSLNEDEAPRAWKDAEPILAPHTPVEPDMPVAPLSLASDPDVEARIIVPEIPRMHHKKHMSFATKFFLGSMVFFFGAIGVSAVLFFGGVNTTSPQNIDVQIIMPSLVDGGKQADFEMIITNRNTTPLELADLVIDYPEGARSPNDATKPLTHERISIGTINSGQQIKRTASALFYGSEGTPATITARLEYSVAGSNSVFEKQGQTEFTIGSAPISLTIQAPDKATAGTPFTMQVTVHSNAATPVESVAVEAQVPFGFTITGSDPTTNGSVWRLGTMQPGTTKTISITGSIEASDGDERVFRFLVGANVDQTDPHVKVPFLTVPQSLTVERAFITGSLTLEGKSGASVSAAAGKTLNGIVHWKNNLSDSITGLELSLLVEGPAVDKNTINAPNGFYQSSNSTIVWTSQGDSSLANVPPGGEGSFQFSFATLAPGANGTLITNPTIKLSLAVRGTRQSDAGAAGNVASAASMKVTLSSALDVSAQTTRTIGPFTNSGPMPPRAEQETSYTITWTVKNSANTVANTIAQALLPPYVKFVSGESGVTYDQGTRMVKWSLGDVKAGAGYTLAARTASFQVSISPSTSQVGTTPQLTGALLVAGQDRFAQVQVEGTAEAVTIHADDVSGMDTVGPK